MSFHQSIKIYTVLLALIIVAMDIYSQSTITVNVDSANTVIKTELFGVLMERLGRQWTGQGNSGVFVGTSSTIPNTNGMRNDVIDGFKECGIGAIEWPGGCAANSYDWSHNKKPSSDVGVDRFIQFCKLTGAEAVIAGKATAGDAASNLAFAQYIMDSLNYPLKWFKIGNEVWGCGGGQSVSTYMGNFTANFNKLKDLKNTTNGKNLSIISAAGSVEPPSGNFDWIPTMITGFGNSVDAFEYHDYIYHTGSGGISSTNPSTANYWTIINDAVLGDIHSNLCNNVYPKMDTSDPAKRIKLVLDEWGDWLMDTGDGWAQQNTVMDALSAGSQLHMFLQHADRMGAACLAQGINVIHSIININTNGVMAKTPTFYIFKLFKPHHSNNAKLAPFTASHIETVNGNGTNLPAVNAVASEDSNNCVNISFTNVDLTATRQVKVTLTSSKAPYFVNSAEVVTGSEINSCNDFGASEQVNIKTLNASNYSINGNTLSVTLPAKSVVMIRLSPVSQAVQPGNYINKGADIFSVISGSHGIVLITTSAKQKTPVQISFYSADGRTLVNRATGNFENGTCTLENHIGKGVYLVKIISGNLNVMKQVVISK